MDRRFAIFWALAFLIIIVNFTVQQVFFPPPPKVAKRDDKAKVGAKKEADKGKPADGENPPGDKKPGEEKPAADGEKPADQSPTGEKPATEPGAPKEEQPAAEEAPAAPITPRWITLGSADPQQPYRMLVTLTNLGAAIERVELNSARYKDMEDRSGYMGYLATADAPKGSGSLVQVVGPGTPAERAGLKSGDVIDGIDGHPITNAAALDRALDATQPGQTVSISIAGGNPVSVALTRRPLELIRPELNSQPLDVVQPDQHDPLSLLFTLEQVGERKLADEDEELAGVRLRSDAWEVVSADADECVFKKKLPSIGLEVTKHYALAKVDPAESEQQPAYHVTLDIEIRNIGKQPQQIAYRLDGPTGLVLEGAWYASKISHNWGSAGLHDIIGKFATKGDPHEIGCPTIAAGDAKPWPTAPLQYVAVDGQYFSAAVLPADELAEKFMHVTPIRVGAVPKEKADYKLTDVSFRIVSNPVDLDPNGSPLRHTFKVFMGPKQPALLNNYGPPRATLGALVTYGLFGFVAEPMLWVLHWFYSIVHNYGVAIVMLTVLVRGCMFPLSRKQAVSSQKMQELQPQIKQLTEKYKKQPEQLRNATQELYRKNNFNPLGGCLPMFVQLPIFMGLYRSLMVDVELRQAPLISDAIRWCSNLAAPDMLYDWRWLMPTFVTAGSGFLGLGPYLNVFPLVTIGLFIWQQKMFMPPPTDEQAAMQQKMMQYMMVFMGVMFFKVASGLCLYFIASSLWGVSERKLLHPPQASATPGAGPAGGGPSGPDRNKPGGNGRGGGGAGKTKQRGRK